MKFDKLGWIVAAGLAGAMVMSGFQGPAMKFGTVDVEKVFDSSSLTQESNHELQTYGTSRARVLQFLKTYRVASPADAKNYVTSVLKAKPTEQDSTAITQIETAAAAMGQKQQDLLVKTNPTADEQKSLSDMRNNMQQNNTMLGQLSQQYEEDIRVEQGKLRNEALEKVRKTIGEYARKQGYTIVFSVDAAPFAANSLTDEVVKEVSSKN